MTIKVKNNLAAIPSLGQLNITEPGKALAKVSCGQKINSNVDDAAGLANFKKDLGEGVQFSRLSILFDENGNRKFLVSSGTKSTTKLLTSDLKFASR